MQQNPAAAGGGGAVQRTACSQPEGPPLTRVQVQAPPWLPVPGDTPSPGGHPRLPSPSWPLGPSRLSSGALLPPLAWPGRADAASSPSGLPALTSKQGTGGARLGTREPSGRLRGRPGARRPGARCPGWPQPSSAPGPAGALEEDTRCFGASVPPPQSCWHNGWPARRGHREGCAG